MEQYSLLLTFSSSHFCLQVKDGMFDKERFDDLCWMMTSKKNFKVAPKGELLSERDSFKLFCLFNLLSEDRYPLVMIPEEVNDSDKENCFGCDLILQIPLITECASALRTQICASQMVESLQSRASNTTALTRYNN